MDVWERTDEETDSAWAAFRIYRDLPPQDRSLVEAYVEYSAAKTGSRPKRPKAPPGYISVWSSAHNWVERVLAYDRYIDAQAVKAVEQDHVAKLNEFRARLLGYARMSTDNAIRAMGVIERSIQALDRSEDNPDGVIIEPRELSKFIMATTKLFEAAAEQESRALAVDSLLEVLSDAENQGKKLH